MFRAAVRPWLNATSQCSTRIGAAVVDDALVLGRVAGGVDAGRRGPQARIDRDAAAARRAQGRRRGRASRRDRARADHDRVGIELRPLLVTTLRHPPVGALEPLELLPAVNRDPVLLKPRLEEPARLRLRSPG